MDRVSIAIENGIADVRMVRPDKMNALDDVMADSLIAAGEAVAKDKSIRVVVLSGEGRAFCAGLDMSKFSEILSGEPRTPNIVRTHGIANNLQKAVWVWRECPVPVIAAVHGVCFGGGFQLSLGADIRITHPDTKISIMEVKWGLVPDMCGPYFMQGLSRPDIVRRLSYTGEIFTGAKALEYGFATQLSDDPHAEAMALAAEIASKSPGAIMGSKKLYNEIVGMNEAETFLREAEIQDILIGSENQMEAVFAEIQKRGAMFEDER